MTQSEANPFFIVGIGASAGGLRALEEFFRNMPADSGAAFVVIQHLSPDFKSLMKELLERCTQMDVHRVEDDMCLEANRIYLITPRNNLVIEQRRLRTIEQEGSPRHQPNFPIDIFLQSLSIDCGDRAIGVILSGTGSDGTKGLLSISDRGGLAFAQSPVTAEFDGMPQSAIASGVVDQVLSPADLARMIHDIVRMDQEKPNSNKLSLGEMEQGKLKQVIKILSESEKVDFSYYKPATLSRRIYRRCSLSGHNTLDEYINHLKTSPDERSLLQDDLMIGVTRFFRDPEAWAYLETHALPTLINSLDSNQQLRIWVTACATGEEAYSMAILVDELLTKMGKTLNVKIFATDIDSAALNKASEGMYSENIISDILRDRLERYFNFRHGNFHIIRKLREMIIFAPHNLAKNAGFTRVHLISCRNVLIYMQPSLQQQVLRMLHFSLSKKGILFLGAAETPGELAAEFIPQLERSKIYQKRRDARLPIIAPGLDYVPPKVSRVPQAKVSQTRFDPVLDQAFSIFVKQRRITCFLVNADYELIHLVSDPLKILQVPQGQMTRAISAMMPKSLQLPLNTALHRAKRQQTIVSYCGIQLEEDEQSPIMNVKVTYQSGNTTAADYFLVEVTDEVRSPVDVTDVVQTSEPYQIDQQTTQRLMDLETELQQTRENLQATIEELETTNEEQQATNEELLASNEELQSTNEELHSVNEELYTVNTEYQSKIKELTDLTNDMENLLRTTDIGVVFLDEELRIRKFTPAAILAINLVETDIERPLEHLTHNMDYPNLQSLLQQVVETEKPIEREVQLIKTGDNFLMRLHPYIRDDGQFNGIVLTFIKINDIKLVQQQLENRTAELENLYSTTPVGLCLFNEQFQFLRVNNALAQMHEYSVQEHIGQSVSSLLPELAPHLEPLLQQVLDTNQSVRNREIFGITTSGGEQHHCWRVNYYPVNLANGKQGINGVVIDVTELKQIETVLLEREEQFRQLVETIREVFFITSQRGEILYVSPAYQQLWGQSCQELYDNPDNWFLSVHPQDQERVAAERQAQLTEGNTLEHSYRIIDAQRQERWIQCRSFPVKNEAGEVYRFVGLAEDITQRQQFEVVLKEAKNKADTANAAKSEFLANMSHEIRTPMNAILGFSELLKERISEPMSHSYIESIVASGQTLLSLINDILDLSKIEAGKLDVCYEPLNLRGLMEEIRNIFSQKAAQKNLALLMNVDETVPSGVYFDQVRLRQILFNIVGNALKFTPQGSVLIQVSCQEEAEVVETFRWNVSEHNVSGHNVSEYESSPTVTLIVSVKDTGIGIAPQEKDLIFEAFQQSRGQSTPKYGGTGLGLTITRRLTQILGGVIELESQLGKGSTFTCIFPHVAIAEVEPSSASLITFDNNLDQFVPATLLVVDDVQSNLDLLQSYFTETQHRLLCTTDGMRGIELAQTHHPDIIFLDLRMPKIDGWETARRLKQNPDTADIPIVILTAAALKQEHSQQIQSLYNGFLCKPIRRYELVAQLTEILPIKPETLPSPQQPPSPSPVETIGEPTAESLAKLPELLEKLELEQQTHWQPLCQTLKRREVRNWIQTLRQWAIEYQYQELLDYTITLQTQLQSFDWQNLPHTIEQFPLIVEKLALTLSPMNQ